MELSVFAFRVLLVFLPGLIGFYLIVDKLTDHRPYRVPQIVIYSLLHGFASYVLYAVLLAALIRGGLTTRTPLFFNAVIQDTLRPDLIEIGWVTVVGAVLGLVLTVAITNKVMHRVAHALRLSRRFGDQDVWDYVMNSPLGGWVIVRDTEQDLAYYGYVAAFSQPGERDELLLTEVAVHQNSTGTTLYETGAVYLPRPREKLTVEFPIRA